MKRKLLNGCALSLAIACGNGWVLGQTPNYQVPLYSGTSLAPQYVAYVPTVQANPYASYFQIPGEQPPAPPAINPGQYIPQGGHQHVQPMTIPQGNQNQGLVSPLPAIEPQPQYYQPAPAQQYQAPAQQYQAVPQNNQGAANTGCQSCQQSSGTWQGYNQGQAYGAAPAYGAYGYNSGLAQPWTMARTAGPSMYFVGANGLYMSTVDSCNQRLSYDSNNPTDAILSTQSAAIGAGPGYEVFGGRYFNCGRNAIAVNYWSILDNSDSATVYSNPGENFRSSLPFTTLGPGGNPATLNGIEMPTQNVYDWYDASQAHRITRSNSFNNLEVNVLGFAIGGAAISPANAYSTGGCGLGRHCGGQSGCSSCGNQGSGGACRSCFGGPGAFLSPSSCSRLRLTWLSGFRWFQYKDSLDYATSEANTTFNGGADDFYYRNNVTNDMFGFQLGAISNYCMTKRLSFFGGPKFGIYGNNIQFNTFAGTNTNTATVVSANAHNGMPYDLSSSTCTFACLGEMNVGVGYRVWRCWTAYAGYRVIGATGVATATGQIPNNFANLDDIRGINHCDSLILHGAFFGSAYNY